MSPCQPFDACLMHPAAPTSPLFAKLSPDVAQGIRAFHRTIPGYAKTPLERLDALAREDGLSAIFVKDESKRFSLNAFKCLGSSHALACELARRLGDRKRGKRSGAGRQPLDFAVLSSLRTRAAVGTLTVITATDGNHGRGLAWAARMFGHRSLVLTPEVTIKARRDNIAREGAIVMQTSLVYDECVRVAARMAEDEGFVLVQDTSWPGYERIPLQIMQGYLTIAAEILEDLAGLAVSHVFLQAGVGSFAAALAACLVARFPRLAVVVVEPFGADCILRTARANDGALHQAPGPMNSMMAGLCCGQPASQAWEILSQCATACLACGDDASALGMRLLAHPAGGRAGITSGESGAVTLGVLHALMQDEDKRDLREALGLTRASRVLLVSTEGDTDPINYRNIVVGA